ncbi:Manganese transport system membrane protein MntB [Phycisphaerales bacterium]|nr:Manganese transport system membrane protein MntB [Phycisphaerales bacterium]
MRGLFWPGVVTGLAIAALCSLLSVLVVLKRLAFIGQGISHAAFGGVGIAAAAGLVVGAGLTPRLLGVEIGPQSAIGVTFGIVFLFCLASALLIGWLSERGQTEADTAIGIVLVGAMAVGAILLHSSQTGVSWETFLFGSIMGVEWIDAGIGWGVALVTLLTLWLFRRPLLFWAFDPAVARAMGVHERTMNFLLMTLLALATVTAMKLAGVVLATAMLVLPGAISLRLSVRSGVVIALAVAGALVGVIGGLVVSFEFDWPTGPSIVCVLALLFAGAKAAEAMRHRA